MGRNGHVFYCRTRRQYRRTHPMTGRQVPLSPRGTPESPANEAAAVAAWQSISITSGQLTPNDGGLTPSNGQVPVAGCTAAGAGAAYLAWAAGRVRLGKMSAACLRNYKIAVGAFAAAFGPRVVSTIPPEEIESWAAGPHPHQRRPEEPVDWSATYQRNVLGVVLGLFKLSKCPITLSRPPAESRGAKAVVPDADLAKLVAEAERKRPGGQGDVGPLLRVLRETGARPGEVAGLRVEDVDWANACVVLVKHKTRHRTGRGRTLVFNPEAMRVLEQQRAKWGSGHLFRTKMRKAWNVNVLAKQLITLSARCGVKVFAYAMRHTFATDKLKKGMPDSLVAAALGHRGTAMLHAHYSHLTSDTRAIRDAMDRADRAAG